MSFAAGQVFQRVELRLCCLHSPLQDFNAGLGSNAMTPSSKFVLLVIVWRFLATSIALSITLYDSAGTWMLKIERRHRTD